MQFSSLRGRLPSTILAVAVIGVAPFLMAPDEPPCGKDCSIEVVDAWRVEEQVTIAVTNLRLEESIVVELYDGRSLVDHARLNLPMGRTGEVNLAAPRGRTGGYLSTSLAVYLPQIDHWLRPREDTPRRPGPR